MSRRKSAAKRTREIAGHQESSSAPVGSPPADATLQAGASSGTAAAQSRLSETAPCREELSRQVLELRLAGFSLREICQVLGLKSAWDAWRLQRQALEQQAQEEVTQLRQLEWARLDRLIRTLWRQSVQGDLPTLDRLLKLLQQRERYVRQWAKQTKSETIPRMTLLQALAADRQLEAWLQQHRPQALPHAPEESLP